MARGVPSEALAEVLEEVDNFEHIRMGKVG